MHLIEGKKPRANSSALRMSATQLPSHEGTSSDPKATPNVQSYDSDDPDEEEMLDALIRNEMGDG